MRVDNIFVRSSGVRLPDYLPVAAAVTAGEFDSRAAAATDMVSVAYSPDEAPPELAVAAARSALKRAELTDRELDLLLHADTYFQGHDFWPVASYVQREVAGGACPAIEVRQMSNGGMAALDLAVAYLTADRSRETALVTTADRFCPPGLSRWTTDPGAPYADGGTAVVLSKHAGYARVRSLALLSDPELEPMHRANTSFEAAGGQPVDFAGSKRAFIDQVGMSYAVRRADVGQRTVLARALDEAGLELADADWVLLPHFGRRQLDAIYWTPYRIDPAKTLWEWTRTVGHLGAGDQFASLDRLIASGRAAVGDQCVVVGVGVGYSWGCAVLEITEIPSWAGLGHP